MLKNDYNRLEVLQWLENQLISTRYPNPKKLSEKFGMSERNARRYFDKIQDELKFSIEPCEEKGGWRLLHKTKSVPGLWLSQEEWLSLLIAEKMLEEQTGPVAREVKELITRYRGDVKEFGDAETLMQKISCQIQRVEKLDTEIFLQCLAALCRNQAAFIVYHSPHDNTISERVISPQHLLNQDGNWILISWCHTKKGLRNFKPSRMQRIEIRPEEKFIPAPQDDIEEHADSAFGSFKGKVTDTAILLFSETKTSWVHEQTWHPKEKKLLRPNNRMELHLPIADEREILMEILSFGADVEVLAPQSLREKVKQQIEKMKKLYSDGQFLSGR